MLCKPSAFAIAAAIFANTGGAVPTTTTAAAAASACTVTEYSQVSGCLSSTAITISNLQVPAGETLTLEKLKSGTTVTFTGTTVFGYKEWVSAPCILVLFHTCCSTTPQTCSHSKLTERRRKAHSSQSPAHP